MAERSPYNHVVEKMQREWDKKQEKAEEAKEGLQNTLKEFFRENRRKLMQEALTNIRSAPGQNPFKRLGGQEGGTFNGYADITGLEDKDFEE